MIAKEFRLKEKEVQKVLRYGKPFFSYSVIAKTSINKLNNSRFAIILSGKNTKNAVTRNYYRRIFYNISSRYIKKKNLDIVIFLKKWIKFELKNSEMSKKFEKEVEWILKKINKN